MSLHLLYLPIHTRQLMLCAREHQLIEGGWSADLGYLVHSLLARLFGPDAPKPFDVQEAREGREGGALEVLAYAGADIGAFAAAQNSPDTRAAEALVWAQTRSKPMPGFGAGQRLGFRVRTCPAVRVGRHHPMFRHGAEVDPYLAQVKRDPTAPGWDQARRLAVYQEWLAARLAPAASLETAQLAAMRDARLWRRGTPRPDDAMHGRPRLDRAKNGRAPIGRREAVFEGTLTVQDPDAFAALLARGIGRHRAFGFGMLLLRPAG